MLFLKKYKLEIFFFLLLTVVYFISRFYHLLSLPIFTDEAIYVRWAQIAKNDATWRFISLTDGKQPMFIWIVMIAMRLIKDPLFASRTISVFAGFLTMIGLFFFGKETFKNRWIGLIGSFIYVLYPFGLVYDRLAIYDGLVTTFTVWSLYFEILLVRYIRLDIAFATALIIGGGVLNKTTEFIDLYAMPVLLLLFNFRQKGWVKKLGQFALYSVLVFILVNLYYSVLRLSPFFHIIAEKNNTFFYTFAEWKQHPWKFFIGNVNGLIDWTKIYVMYPVLALIAASFFVSFKNFKEKLLLFGWFLGPFLIFALIAKIMYPRYLLPMTISLLPLAGYTLYEIAKKSKLWIAIIVGILCMALYIRADYFILTDFAHAPIPSSDLGQLINDWPAGGGVKETTAFFAEQAKNNKIVIATEGTFGLMPAAYEISLVDNPHVKIQGLWPISDTLPAVLTDASKKYPTYVVFYQPCVSCRNGDQVPSQWPVKLLASYQRGISNRYLRLYQVIPQK